MKEKDIASLGERYFHSVKGLCVRERKSERVREAVLLQGISIYLRYGGNFGERGVVRLLLKLQIHQT